MRIICYVSSRLCKNAKIIHVHQNAENTVFQMANSEMAPYFFIYANRKEAERREVTKQVVWIIRRNRIFHGTIRHIRSCFPSYARTLCALTLPANALKIQSGRFDLNNRSYKFHVEKYSVNPNLIHILYNTSFIHSGISSPRQEEMFRLSEGICICYLISRLSHLL